PDDLSGSVVRDVAAATGLVHVDSTAGQRVVGRENVRSAAVPADAERQDVWMFDEKQEIADAARPTVFPERARHLEPAAVRHQPEASNFYVTFGSQFSSERFTCDMNSSATAPSITR